MAPLFRPVAEKSWATGICATLGTLGALTVATAAHRPNAPPVAGLTGATDLLLDIRGVCAIGNPNTVDLASLDATWSLFHPLESDSYLETALSRQQAESLSMTAPYDWSCWSDEIEPSCGESSAPHIAGPPRSGLVPGWEWCETPARTVQGIQPLEFFVESSAAAWRSGDTSSVVAQDGEELVLEVRSFNPLAPSRQPVALRLDYQWQPGMHPLVSGDLFIGDVESVQIRNWCSNRFVDIVRNLNDPTTVVDPNTGRIQIRVELAPRLDIETNTYHVHLDRVGIAFEPMSESLTVP